MTTKIEIGTGATRYGYTGHHPYTVIAVSKSGRILTLQEDTATRTDTNGMSECQSYTFASNKDGAVVQVSLRKNGTYVEVGKSGKGATTYAIGQRRKYHDFSF